MKGLAIGLLAISFFMISCLDKAPNSHNQESGKTETTKSHGHVSNEKIICRFTVIGVPTLSLDSCSSDQECMDNIIDTIEDHPHKNVRNDFRQAIISGEIILGFANYSNTSGTMATIYQDNDFKIHIDFNRGRYRASWLNDDLWEEVAYHEYIHWVQFLKGIIVPSDYKGTFTKAKFDKHMQVETEAYLATCTLGRRMNLSWNNSHCPNNDQASHREIKKYVIRLHCDTKPGVYGQFCP